MIRHLSFDFWNTIGVFNPLFSAARVAHFAQVMGVDEATAKAHYVFVKRFVDRQAEETGGSYDALAIFLMTLRRVNPEASEADAAESLATVQKLALDNPPIIAPHTVSAISRMREQGCTTSITSNTNFVTGVTLRQVLDRAGVVYDFGLFSDELPYSKPSPLMFGEVRRRVPSHVEILHYGDNQICDVQGATSAGMTGIYATYEDLHHRLLSSI